jgi:hypothetical protein
VESIARFRGGSLAPAAIGRPELPVEIKSLAPGRGSCIATDKITVQGEKVGYMYREEPDPDNAAGAHDSGWHFFSGTEDDAYANDPGNLQIYDVNTIANYDPEIIPLLDAAVPSAFARDPETGKLVEVEAPSGEEPDE